MVILKSSDKVSIAQIDEKTKEIYRQMSQSWSVIKSMYSSEKFPQTWESLKANDFVCPVIENQTGRYVASLRYWKQKVKHQRWESISWMSLWGMAMVTNPQNF